MQLALTVLDATVAVCRLEPTAAVPEWALAAEFSSVTRTPEELSIVCAEDDAPLDAVCERGWRCLQVTGPIDFELVGVAAAITTPLAEAGVSVFFMSTYDTDWVLVQADDLERAIGALEQAGHVVASSK